ncbi:MAG: pyridoxal-phosphate-dependent aminotransferase family protein [Candidatus Cryptobacteroides sp.]|jgi:aspartate aminotransferase-like enzyme
MKSYVFPGDIDTRIMEIGSKPFPYMRTDAFSRINKESEQMLLELFHCSGGKTIIYTGSGTGAMSGIVESYVCTKRKAFVINGGDFGQRWYELCNYYGVPAVNYTVPFARDIDYANLRQRIADEKPDVLLCQHHETSTGQLFNLKELSRICLEYGVSLVVDAISSFLAEPLSMDDLGIDICVCSTQKGLNIPPGLSIVVISKKLEGYPFSHKGFYWDFSTNLGNLSRGQTPYSPATILYLQLHARLKQIMKEGGEDYNIARVRHRSELFRSLCAKYGWDIPAEVPSTAITGFQTADKERKIFNSLIEKYDTYIMPSSTPGFYRVSHMGLQSDEDLQLLAERIHESE